MCAQQAASPGERGRIADQIHELYRLMTNWTRHPYLYRRPLQELIEGRIQQYLFTHPAAQLKMVREWSYERRRWGITDGEFLARMDDMPDPVMDGLKAVVLVPYLMGTDGMSGPERTLHELLMVGNLRNEGINHRSVDIDRPNGHPNGLRWETIDLGAVPDGDRTEYTRASYAAVAAAAVLHPNWMNLVSGRVVPFPMLPGCKFGSEGESQVFTDSTWNGGPHWRLNLECLSSLPQGVKVSLPAAVTTA